MPGEEDVPFSSEFITREGAYLRPPRWAGLLEKAGALRADAVEARRPLRLSARSQARPLMSAFSNILKYQVRLLLLGIAQHGKREAHDSHTIHTRPNLRTVTLYVPHHATVEIA